MATLLAAAVGTGAALATGCAPGDERQPATHEVPGAERPATAGTGGGEGAEVPDVTGTAPPAEGGIPSVVTLEPLDSTAPVPGSDLPPPVVDQFGLTFIPRVLVVRVGMPVTFTNSEGALTHNVHVRSMAGDSTVFDGDTSPGQEAVVELPGPGGYDVLCDMHPGMTAFLFATDAPWAAAADPDGSFGFETVPAGTYAARVWTADDGFSDRRRVTVAEDGTRLELGPPP